MWKTPEFWVAVSFAIFCGIAVKAGALKALFGGLDGRAQQVRDELAEARRLREDAEKLLADYEAKRKAAEQEADAIVAAAREESDRLAADAKTRIDEFVRRRTAQADQKIAQAEAQAMADVRAAAADAAVRASEQILRSELVGKAGEALALDGLKQLAGRFN